MKKTIWLLLFVPFIAFAGRKKKTKKVDVSFEQLKTDITYLASDELEGRRTGTEGEKKAANYIAKRFMENGISPFSGDAYLQKFEVQEGFTRSENQNCAISEQELLASEFTGMPFSANGNISALIMNKVKEQGAVQLIPISSVSKKKLNSPHEDALDDYFKKADSILSKGANGIVFYNDLGKDYNYEFDPKQKTEKRLEKVIVYVNHDAFVRLIKPRLKADWVDFTAEIDVQPKIRTGFNVTGFIDNKAPKTVVIGAHYDHLGYGEDHNSLFADTIPAIHNGADDNASGVGAILALSKLCKEGKSKNYNYLFIAFSGEELGLYGSKKFVEQNESFLPKVNYMINIDMLGRYDDTKKALTIGGVGTSPTWIPMIENSKKFFTPKWDSAGVGPSDHTSFYMKNIPVLFFFTGLHTDYHKPSDDADKINYVGEQNLIQYIYSLVENLDKSTPLVFTKTREPKQEGARFKVTLGIMPDYTFSGIGVKADGVTEGKLASRIGMLAGDVILQLGETKVTDMQTYMEALSKFKEGDETQVTIERSKEKKVFPVKFVK
jgi:aminopeptidase YwaD